jgi:hypothetical protein
MNRPTLVASSVSIWRFVKLPDGTSMTLVRRDEGRAKAVRGAN